MARLKYACPGNCAECELLNSGEVQMVPCILDQIFQRQQSLTTKLETLIDSVEELKLSVNLASMESEDSSD